MVCTLPRFMTVCVRGPHVQDAAAAQAGGAADGVRALREELSCARAELESVRAQAEEAGGRAGAAEALVHRLQEAAGAADKVGVC